MSDALRIEASEIINARPEELYAIVSDYRVGHPAILPRPPFGDLIVEEGGRGEGTVLRCSLAFFGKAFPFRQRVSEPEPGRVIRETDTDTGLTTLFTFEPLLDGSQTRVTITSIFPPSRGIASFIQRLIYPRMFGKLYVKELNQLADYARSKRTVATQRV